jgi:catechol 2,3-dioxygenase-like lactoylglutathione lyase family enzyme
MSAYVTLGSADTARDHVFYDAVLTTIGWSSHMSFPGWRAYSKGGGGEGFILWVVKPFDGEPASVGNGTMVGLFVDSHDAVDSAYAAAMAQGASDEGAPGPRPDYGPKWYAAYLRDPSGNKLAFVCNS